MMLLNKDHIRRQFNRSATSYDRVAGMQRDIVDHLIAKLPTEIAKAKVIADLGCGTGYALAQLTKCASLADLVGVDLAPNMLECVAQRLMNVDLRQGDIEALPLQDGAADLSFSSSAIQWCDLGRAINEIKRVTRAGGCIAISSFVEGTLESWRRLWPVSGARFMSGTAFSAAIHAAGLSDVELQFKTYQQRFYSFEHAVKSIRDLGAGNAEQDRTRGLMGRAQYRAIKRRAEQIIEQQGGIVLTYKVVFVVARK